MRCVNLTDFEEKIEGAPFDCFSRVDDIYLCSEVLLEEQINFIKERKIAFVLNLTTLDLEGFFTPIGINCMGFPIHGLDDLDWDKLWEIRQAFRKISDHKLIISKDGGISAAMIAFMLCEVCGHPRKRAMDLARKIGLKDPDLIEKVEEKLKLNLKETLNKCGG